MKLIPIVLLFLTNVSVGQSIYQKDFTNFWTIIGENYAYFEQQQIDWNKVREIYSPLVSNIDDRDDFIRLLENCLNELHNGHISLNTNLLSSNRLIPSGADMFIEKKNNRYFIKDLRKDYGAEKSGLKIGMEVIQFNDLPIEKQLDHFLPKYTEEHNADMYQYAVSLLFAGTHDTPRKITTIENGIEKDYFPDAIKVKESIGLLEVKYLDKNTAYIKIQNCLWNNDLIHAFDSVLDSVLHTKQLVLDLTETPGGGNTTVARAMLGRFIKSKRAYQQHEMDELPFDTKRNWMENVFPRKTQYKGKVIVMVGHWTGSMGEGIAIGFDGMKKVTLIGTKMAGLIGAISGFQLPETKIGFQIPTERLYHVNGTPREDFRPEVLTQNSKETWSEMKKRFHVKE